MLFFALGVSAQVRDFNQPADAASQQEAMEARPVYYSVLDANGTRVTGQTNQWEVQQGNSPIAATNESVDFSALAASDMANVKSILLDANTNLDGDHAALLEKLLASGLLNAEEQSSGEAILADFLGQ